MLKNNQEFWEEFISMISYKKQELGHLSKKLEDLEL